jgi:hypothetical protein
LFILIDDAATSLGLQLDELRAFINSQPATTAIAVGYMQYGTVQTVQSSTKDHSLAAKSLRLPMGSASGSPYFSVEDLIKHWPEGPVPREILMVSDGID